ncbi:hypothetical protein GL998_02550 [Facklamia sp. 253]|nr:hypothetical protein [Facklamia sp. 253]
MDFLPSPNFILVTSFFSSKRVSIFIEYKFWGKQRMLILFCSGAILGSFYTFICEHRTLFHSRRSHCDFCHTPLKWSQLIPIFSAIIYRKTPCCHRSISHHYLLIELWCSLLFILLYPVLISLSISHAIVVSILVSWLLLLAIYDLVYLEVTWIMLFISFILSVYLYSLYPQNLLFSLCLWLILESIILIRPNWLGGADSKLFAILSLTLPVQAIPILLATSSMTGLIWIAVRKQLGHSTQTVIPFIPCIVTGYVVALLFAYQ